MRKSPPADFEIHVDASCLTDSTDLDMPSERTASSETVVHHELEPEPEIEPNDEQQPEEEKDEIQEFLDELSQHEDMSGVEEQEVEEHAAEEHEPASEEHAAGELDSAVEEQIAEDPAVEEDPIEEPVLEENVVEQEPAVEEHVTEEPVAEEPSAEEHAVEKPMADGDSAEDHAAEGLPTEEPSSEENTTEEHTTAEHGVEDHRVEDHRVQDSEGDADEDEVYEEEDHEEDAERQEQRDKLAERTEALIQAAARAVVASIEQDSYDTNNEDSVLSTQTDESYDQSNSETTYDEGTELTYGDGTEMTYDGTEAEETYESETEHRSKHEEGDSSSQHDGDIDDDDIFSDNSNQSKRSSLNSSDGQNSGEEVYQGKALASPTVGEEAASKETMSRITSISSFREANPRTPSLSKVISRPPFRTPSSVRAMQMSSPSPSLFCSPRSNKRQVQNFNPTVSRLGTPSHHDSESSQSRHFSPSNSKNKTPTRVFKTKVERPLVLLHVTVLPLQFQYAAVMSTSDEELPMSLSSVKDSWRLLQEKLGEQVFARGILLSHPQDSYEVLEERLLETLELPVRPRAGILKCGHYMGPEDPTSADESGDDLDKSWVRERKAGEKAWCDICSRNVKYEQNNCSGERKFRIKVYASNGLMKAGAWAAAWREMERVDVEIEPFIEGDLLPELEHLLAQHQTATRHEEEAVGEHAEEHPEQLPAEEEQTHEEHHSEEEHTREEHHFEEEQLLQHHTEEEQLRQKAAVEEDKGVREKAKREERMREIYGDNPPPAESSRHTSRSRSRAPKTGESLPELLLAAFKVAMRDQKNILICILSMGVLVLALRPVGNAGGMVIQQPAFSPEKIGSVGCAKDAVANPLEVMPETPAKIKEDAQLKTKRALKRVEIELPPVAEDDEGAEAEAELPKMKKVPKKAAQKSPPPVEEVEEDEEGKLSKTKKVPKPARKLPPQVREDEYEAEERPKPKKAPKKIEAQQPLAEEDDGENFDLEAPARKLDSQVPDTFDLEAPGDEDVQPVEQEHYHIEPPSQKKTLKKPNKEVVNMAKGVEPVGQRQRK